MRPLRPKAQFEVGALLTLGALLAGCAAGPRIVATQNDRIVTVRDVAKAVADADVVALGELHQTPDVHRTHLELVQALHERRPEMVIAMEMFERPDQDALDLYLNGLMDYDTFAARTEVWPRYETDYKPLVEWAARHGVAVLGANAPKSLVTKARKEGLAAVAGDKDVAREIEVPEGDEFDAFVKSMSGHPGVSLEDLRRYYSAQCVWNATMAETVLDYRQKAAAHGRQPLVVLVCGKQHSDHWRGAVGAMQRRQPDLKVRVVSVEEVADLGAGIYESSPDVADYVIVIAEPERGHPAVGPVKKPAEPQLPPAAKPADKPAVAAPTTAPAVEVDPNARPALGLMPDYNGGAPDGIVVEGVRPGGGAEKAGIEAGDVILAMDGQPTPDFDAYMKVLGTLTVGKAVTVRVRRGEAEVDLQVVVGARIQ
ncbi:MAG: ChaN family lipoprotein [Planctomycetota bacterium]